MATHGHTPHLEEHADAWHHHSSAEGVPQHEHAAIVSPFTLLKAFVGITVTVVAVVVAIVMYYQTYTTKLKAERIETDKIHAGAQSQKSTWQKQLTGYGAVGDKPGVYSIPIDAAMDKVVAKYSSAKAPSSK